jgi:hypothetical protein
MFIFHYVNVDDITHISDEILYEYRRSEHRELKSVKMSVATKLTDAILSRQHDFDANAIEKTFHEHMSIFHGSVMPHVFVSAFGWQGEGLGYFVEQTTQDVILVNNFYGYIPKWRDLERVSGMQFLQNTFHGDITWKLIEFPFHQEGNYTLDEQGFHRGSCYMVRFRKGTGKKKHSRRPLSYIERAVRDFVAATKVKQYHRESFSDIAE